MSFAFLFDHGVGHRVLAQPNFNKPLGCLNVFIHGRTLLSGTTGTGSSVLFIPYLSVILQDRADYSLESCTQLRRLASSHHVRLDLYFQASRR